MITFIILAFALGIKHSLDADHLCAVSNILVRINSIKKSVRLSLFWVAGHMITAAIVTIILFSIKAELVSSLLEKMEIFAGVIIILLGIWGLKRAYFWHSHSHLHEGFSHSHIHPHQKNETFNHTHKHLLGIGILQGITSNDELLILLAASLGVSTLLEALFGVGIFSLGVAAGMIAYSAIFSIVQKRLNKIILQRWIEGLVGVISIFYGSWMLFFY